MDRLKYKIVVRYAQEEDRSFWFKLDQHLPQEEFTRKVRDRMAYIVLRDGEPAGILRYNLFWDTIPFCTLLFVDWPYQRQGLGSKLMAFWERDMQSRGHTMVMTSTQADETAQHFYRKIGYRDSGCLLIDIPPAQPTELFFIKAI